MSSTLTTTRALAVPPELVAGIAMGMESPVALADRHGVSEAELAALLAQPWFMREVEKKRAELADDISRAKYLLMAEDLRDRLFIDARSAEMSAALRLEILRYFNKMADAEPKPQAAQGSNFAVVINLGDGQPSMTITAPVEAAKPDENVIDLEMLRPPVADPVADLPEPPKYITGLPVPGFELPEFLSSPGDA